MMRFALPFTNVPDRCQGRPGRRLSRLARAAFTTLCVSISTAAWADTERFELSGFNGISAAEGIHIQVTIGEAFEVIAESEDRKQLELLELDVRRGILRAQMDDGFFSLNWAEREKVIIRVIMPSLIRAETFTGAKIVADAMSGSALELAASSGSSLQINAIDGGSMSVDVSSGADIKIAAGICTSLSANISGGSFLDMENVVCAKVEIDTRSGSNASVHVDKSINADASSGSRIRVYGAHNEVEIDVSSGGKVDFP